MMDLQQPVLLSVHDLIQMGMTRSMAYQLLNRADLPVVKIGMRKFMLRELFVDWLRRQTSGTYHNSGT